jgi:hypothetical protein
MDAHYNNNSRSNTLHSSNRVRILQSITCRQSCQGLDAVLAEPRGPGGSVLVQQQVEEVLVGRVHEGSEAVRLRAADLAGGPRGDLRPLGAVVVVSGVVVRGLGPLPLVVVSAVAVDTVSSSSSSCCSRA